MQDRTKLGKVTVKEVAAHAGVSLKTASRVLNNSPNVRPEKREAVLQAAKELNFRPKSFSPTTGQQPLIRAGPFL